MLLTVHNWKQESFICDNNGKIVEKNASANAIKWLPSIGSFFQKSYKKQIFTEKSFHHFFLACYNSFILIFKLEKNSQIFYLLQIQENTSHPSFFLQKKLKKMQKLLYQDALTGLYNYLYWKELVRSNTLEHPFCLLVLDLNNFKLYNDKYGHLAGDVLLKRVAICLKKNIRSQDIAIRYAGDEFIIIAQNSKNKRIIAKKIQTAIKQEFILNNITASIGGACFSQNANLLQLFKIADQELYQQKKIQTVL